MQIRQPTNLDVWRDTVVLQLQHALRPEDRYLPVDHLKKSSHCAAQKLTALYYADRIGIIKPVGPETKQVPKAQSDCLQGH